MSGTHLLVAGGRAVFRGRSGSQMNSRGLWVEFYKCPYAGQASIQGLLE